MNVRFQRRMQQKGSTVTREEAIDLIPIAPKRETHLTLRLGVPASSR